MSTNLTRATMVPLSPNSCRKRNSPHSDDGSIDEPTSRRMCLEPPSLKSTSSRNGYSGSKVFPKMFDDDPHKLLLRSVTLALQHVGFDAGTPEALGAFCDEVETYASRFLSKVTSSMLNSRRSQPTPLDFTYALAEFDLPLLSIEPHLCPPIPASKLRVKLELAAAEELPVATNTLLLGEDLNGEPDKRSKAYIPKRFPSFPSKHTYKWTGKESARETDPRKIREEAAKAARQGEEALRRLTKVGKAGQEKDAKNIANKDPKSKERHEIWESVMQNLLAMEKAPPRPTAMVTTNDDDTRSMIVNAERPFFRKGPPRRKLPSPIDPFETLKI